MMVERDVYVGLGSNLGDRAAMLAAGRRELEALGRVTECSSVYETVPWKVPDPQPMCLNQVCRMETELCPQELLEGFHRIEERQGRDRHKRLTARELDIDLLVYGKTVTEGPGVVVPHPRLCERAFVVVPLAEIAPDLVVPGTGERVADVLERLDVSTVHVWSPALAGGPCPSTLRRAQGNAGSGRVEDDGV